MFKNSWKDLIFAIIFHNVVDLHTMGVTKPGLPKLNQVAVHALQRESTSVPHVALDVTWAGAEMCEDISHSHSGICLANKAMHCSLVSCESLRAFSVIMCLEELKKAWWVHGKRSCSLLWCCTCRRLYSWVHRRTCVNVALLEMGILVILSTWVQINQPSFCNCT